MPEEAGRLSDGGVPGDDAPDGSLLAAAPPKRTMRSLTVAVMAVTALLTGWLAWSLRGEAAYALSARQPLEVGILADADLPALQGRHVRGYAHLEGASWLGYRRPFEDDAYRVARARPGPHAADSAVWVIYGVPNSLDGPRFVPPSLVAGRLARVDSLSVRFRGIDKAISDLSGGAAAGGYVLIDGEDPDGLGWLLGLEALLLLFIGFNVASIARVLRRIRPDESGDRLTEQPG